MGPSASTSHTATAMDPVHGSQWSVSSTDITLTAKQGAALTSSYGSDGMGEVSTGTASTAFTGQRNQPTDATRQLFIVDDTALTGHPSHSAAVHGDTPMEVEMGPAPLAHRPCRTNWAFPFRVSLACPGFSPPSRELGHPRDSPAPPWGLVNFQGRGKRQPSGRHRPSTGGPLLSQRPFTGPLDPTAMPFVGVATRCNLSEPSRVVGPSGSTSHTTTAMDPVHGSQWSVSSTDITLTAKQGTALTSSYGSNSMGEVSTGTASTALTGQRSQPTDATGQLFIVDDTALTGHASHSAATHEVSTGPLHLHRP